GHPYAKALVVFWSGAKRNPEIGRIVGGMRPLGDKVAEPRLGRSDDAPLGVPYGKNVRGIRIVVDAAQFRRQIDPPAAVLVDRYKFSKLGRATNELPIAEGTRGNVCMRHQKRRNHERPYKIKRGHLQ